MTDSSCIRVPPRHGVSQRPHLVYGQRDDPFPMRGRQRQPDDGRAGDGLARAVGEVNSRLRRDEFTSVIVVSLTDVGGSWL
ncbi:hypothetical protein [Microbispora catharanthi]|uniref:Uncharacterized protein n=1 Tax=Microbispora catharanthi TaxID=1712871 RepID=A0A5N6BNY9_9ACTN|nr:hypothetical protein [Microbispora catharanthi]KAB8182306.1 hypothetical protein FH610_025700 [Microbispora catharanthi]